MSFEKVKNFRQPQLSETLSGMKAIDDNYLIKSHQKCNESLRAYN